MLNQKFEITDMNRLIKTFILFTFLLSVGTACKDRNIRTSSHTPSTPSSAPTLSRPGVTKAETVKEAPSGMEAPVPKDPDVRIGTLSNGMKYYIKKNGKPENRLELRLAVNAGSMQEEDNQQGLAHFVEHMAFNGTTNFEKNDLIDFLESTGVRFGADLNAYTGFDETVYMLQVPSDDPEVVRKGLLVMEDWATGIAFENEEIDKERGVIVSEWRSRLGAGERMRNQYWDKLFPDSKYAERLPIGDMDIVQNAPYERFKTFYKDWYRPDLMALVVVGDLDVDAMEKEIIDNFSKLKNPESPKERVLETVNKSKGTIVATATDKEARGTDVEIIYLHPAFTINNLEDYRSSVLHSLYNRMLNARLDEISNKVDAPFLSGNSSYSSFVRTVDVYGLAVSVKEGEAVKGMKAIFTEAERARRFGFTESELERQKLSTLTRVERAYKERDKTESNRLSMGYVYNFLDNNPIPDSETRMKLFQKFLPTIKIEEINELTEKWMTEDKVVIITGPEKEGSELPSEDIVKKTLNEVKDLELEAYKDKFLDIPLFPNVPKPTAITAGKEIKELGVKEFKLANGIKLILKPTTFKNDQVIVQGTSPGGHSLYSLKDFNSASNADAIVVEGGVGPFDKIALSKKLTGKTVNVNPYIGELTEGFSGGASTEDLETLFQLINLYVTQPRKDKEAFDAYMTKVEEQVKNLKASPRRYFIDKFSKIISQDNPRKRNTPTAEDLASIDLDRAFEIYNERFADMSDFTFTFVGNFDEAKIKELSQIYLGTLPTKNRKETWKNINTPFVAKALDNRFEKGIAPQSQVIVAFKDNMKATDQNIYDLRSMISVLSIRVRENLREDKGGVYSPSIGVNPSILPNEEYLAFVFFSCAPEDVDKLIDATIEEIEHLRKNGASEENLIKVKETQRRTRETNMEKNSWWLRTLDNKNTLKKDPMTIFDYDKRIEALDSEAVKQAAIKYLDTKKVIKTVLNPESKE